MKKLLFIAITLLTLSGHAQDKSSYVHFNQLTEVIGTEYVIASIENWGKITSNNSRYLLFINTTNGSTKQVDFPNGYMDKIQQVKIDAFGINKIVVLAQTVDLDGKGVDWEDPRQIIVLSTDGQEKSQLTANNFFTRTWAINEQTGTIIITGHFDSNGNNKYDKTDKSEIHIYDLRNLKLISKI